MRLPATRMPSIGRPLTWAAVTLLAMLAVLAAQVSTAAAASLGTLTAATLYCQDTVMAGKQVYGWEDFTTNANNIGATLDSGQAWVSQSGSWRRASGAGFDNQSGVAQHVDANLAVTDAEIFVTMAGTVATRNAGVEFNGGAAGALVVRVVSGAPDVVGLYTMNAAGTALTTVSTASMASAAEADGLILRVVANANLVTVYLNGSSTATLSYTLTGAQVATYKAQTRYGLVANSDKNTTFDDFHVDSTFG